MTFRCSVACEQRGESMDGTASTVRGCLLIEHPGPWGDVALRDARMPDGLAGELRRRSRAAGVRTLLVRRPGGGSRTSEGVRVFAGFAHDLTPWLQTTVLDRIDDVLDLDLAALGAGRSPGLTAHPDSVVAVCTHGRHDACCAERGRPVAAALQVALGDEHPDLVWEVSHVGGDRFAGNLLALPWGLYFGRVAAEDAVGVVERLLGGDLDLDRLRGRSSLSMPLQTAEIALRRHLAVSRLDAVRCRSRVSEGGVTEGVFEVDRQSRTTAWAVRVRTSLSEHTARLTCGADHERQAAVHEVLGIRAAEARAS